MSEEQEDWREKYFESENLLKTLTSHCHQVLGRYEDLKEKFSVNEQQYAEVTRRLQKREGELKELQGVLQPAFSQYTSLQEKFEIEYVCRQEAESFATKVSRENKELRRQSQALLDMCEGPVPEVTVEESTDIQSYLEQLNLKIEELQTECAELKGELSSVREDFVYERDQNNATKFKNENLKAELSQTQQRLKHTESKLDKLQTVSESAIEEYVVLKEDLEEEAVCRFKAEEMASKLLRDNEVMKRQSAALLGPAMSNVKLMKALNQIDELTTQMMEEKEKYEAEIQELKEQLAEAQSTSAMEELEKDLELAQMENAKLQEELRTTQTQFKELDEQCKQLQKQYDEIENKYQEAIRPPPPPPPPPLPSPSKSKGFLGKNKNRRKSKINHKLKKGGVVACDDYSKCISDMMDRINKGQPLKKVTKPLNKIPQAQPQEEGGAMTELQKLLSNMKRTRSDESLLDSKNPGQTESELSQIFRKVKKSQSALDDVPEVKL